MRTFVQWFDDTFGGDSSLPEYPYYQDYLDIVMAEIDMGRAGEIASHVVIKSFIFGCWMDSRNPADTANLLKKRLNV